MARFDRRVDTYKLKCNAGRRIEWTGLEGGPIPNRTVLDSGSVHQTCVYQTNVTRCYSPVERRASNVIQLSSGPASNPLGNEKFLGLHILFGWKTNFFSIHKLLNLLLLLGGFCFTANRQAVTNNTRASQNWMNMQRNSFVDSEHNDPSFFTE